MDNGVDAGLAKDLGNNWVSDIGADELHLRQLNFRRYYVNTDYLINIERLQFSNGKVALDVESGNAGEAAKLIGALLGPNFLKDKALTGIVINLLDQKYSSETIATLGLATPMFLEMAGSNSHKDFVRHVFTNVVGRPPSTEESNTYVNILEAGASQSSLALMAAHTDLNAQRINLVGLIQHGLEFA